MRHLLHTLNQRPLLCDGAMGTQLFEQGLAINACGMLWNIKYPERILAIHNAYIQAGCELLTTNTFGGTAHALASYGLAERMEELNFAGARVAREAIGSSGWVLGNVGPFGGPPGSLAKERLFPMFCAQIAALAAGGSDAILIETMSDPAEMEIAIEAAQAACSLPVIASYAFRKSGSGNAFETLANHSMEECIQRALAAGADVVGANCGIQLALADYRDLASRLRHAAGTAAIMVQPNAGSPHVENGKASYYVSPEEMGHLANDFLASGVHILGGCCGTTPAHLSAMNSRRARLR